MYCVAGSDVSGLGASTASIGAAAAARSSAPLTASAADTSGTYSTAANQLSNTMGMNTTGSMMGNTAGYGGMSSYSSPGYGMGTTGYGATGYGASGYGGYGGMSSYGGYGGGYGSTFGGGYGMSRYGGGYGGGMMGGGYGMGGGMDPNGQMGMLHSFSQTVGSIGQLTEVHLCTCASGGANASTHATVCATDARHERRGAQLLHRELCELCRAHWRHVRGHGVHGHAASAVPAWSPDARYACVCGTSE